MKRTPASFVDSNVVLHALTTGWKAERAREILRARPTINVQVLNEVLHWSEDLQDGMVV
jgi:predicted nucleic acid-binding protein